MRKVRGFKGGGRGARKRMRKGGSGVGGREDQKKGGRGRRK